MKRYSNSKNPRSLGRESCRTVTVGEDEVGVVELPVVRETEQNSLEDPARDWITIQDRMNLRVTLLGSLNIQPSPGFSYIKEKWTPGITVIPLKEKTANRGGDTCLNC